MAIALGTRYRLALRVDRAVAYRREAAVFLPLRGGTLARDRRVELIIRPTPREGKKPSP